MNKRHHNTLAERMMVAEAATGLPGESSVAVAFRVCDKLRLSLSVVTGTAGFRALLLRAVRLASRESPAIIAMRVTAEGFLEAGGSDTDFDGNGGVGGVLLVEHMVDLLNTFIGEELTLRLVDKIWAHEPSQSLPAHKGEEP